MVNFHQFTVFPDNERLSGELQLWLDGKSVINVDGLVLRESDESKIKGMHFQTFFGGKLNFYDP